jgi:hypothetical protein
VYTRISTDQNCGLPQSSNDGRKFSTTGGQHDPRVASLRTGPEVLVRTSKLYWRLQPIAGG